MEVGIGPSVSITGVSTAGAIGSLAFTIDGSVVLSSVSATGVLASLLVWGPVPPGPSGGWTPVPGVPLDSWSKVDGGGYVKVT
jgi:hypothetical protein